MKQTKKSILFSGGLAEMCPEPSDISYDYFSRWFSAEGAWGKGIAMLGLPLQRIPGPLLVLEQGQLWLDLLQEENALYEETIFTYDKNRSIQAPPQLRLKWSKITPRNVWNTLKLIKTQSQWLAQQETMVDSARSWLASAKKKAKSKPDPESQAEALIAVQVAIDFLAEYYRALLEHERGSQFEEAWSLVSGFLSEHDWFIASYQDQFAVRNGEMKMTVYLDEYGLRADNEYELTCPRWHEIPRVLEQRISALPMTPSQRKNPGPKAKIKRSRLIETCSQFQLLRSEAKKALLPVLNDLRQQLGLLTGPALGRSLQQPKQRKTVGTSLYGKGRGLSPGKARGTARHISVEIFELGNETVGIFPDASPRFAHLYPHCSGMIFLKGGLTSHGAIVAREFGIPALVDPDATQIKEGAQLTLDGQEGSWITV